MAQSGVIITLAMALLEAGPQQTLRIDGGEMTFAWTSCHSSPNEDWINDIVPLRDGAFLAVGFLGRVDGEKPSDWRALASKFSADGKIEWTREYGAGGGIDAFWTAREIEDGQLVFGGLTTRIGPGGINAYLAATDATGELLKENAYGTPGYDRITSLAPLTGGFIGAGHAEGVDGRDLFFVGVDQSGVEKWKRVYAEAGSNGALYIEPAGDGAFIVSGGTSPRGDADILVMKIDAEGREIWRRLIGEAQTDDVNHGLAVLDDGRIVVAGYTTSWGAGDRDIVAAVLKENGDVLSIETIGGAGDDRAMLAKKDAEGGVFIIGRTTSAGAGGVDAILVRLAPSGRFEDGAVLFGGAHDDIGAAVRPIAGGDILVGGYSDGLCDGGVDGFVARLSGAGMKKNPALKIVKVK